MQSHFANLASIVVRTCGGSSADCIAQYIESLLYFTRDRIILNFNLLLPSPPRLILLLSHMHTTSSSSSLVSQ